MLYARRAKAPVFAPSYGAGETVLTA